MAISPKNDLGANVVVKTCNFSQSSSAPVLIIAGGTGDATKATGETIDRLGYQSCVFALMSSMTLAATKTISYAVEIADSADGSTWNTATALQAATVLSTGPTGGATVEAVLKLDVDLASYDRYVRFNVTPDLSATGTDTGLYAAVCVLGGADKLVAS